MIVNICSTAECTGCFACQNICPKEAITMQIGKNGHIFPSVQEEKCIRCNLCKKICPVLNPLSLNEPVQTLAAWATDEEEHKTSTSGGIASVLTRYILSDGGVVYGAVVTNHQILHKRVSTQEEAFKLKGSKYVHSHIEYAFREVKQDLDNGLTVLFVGTPCQIAGLKAYVGNQDRNLYTVDLICHGVPSQKLFFNYLKAKGIEQESVTNLRFRDENGFNLKIYSEENTVYEKNEIQDLYYMGFNENLFFRDSCYQCTYAQTKRVGDLTIGDFWGLGSEIPFQEESKGNVSVILQNTEKGRNLLAKVQPYLKVVPRTLEEAVKGNYNLQKPSQSTHKDAFAKDYEKSDLIHAMKKNLYLRRAKSLILRMIHSIQK